MARHHMTPDGPVPFTPEEEAEWDAMEAAAEAEKPIRKAAEVRAERNTRLTETDWTQMPDYNGADKPAWATYRQALRDIPAQPGFPFDVEWPTQPE
jgi:hypothetical protein